MKLITGYKKVGIEVIHSLLARLPGLLGLEQLHQKTYPNQRSRRQDHVEGNSEL